MKGKKGPMNCTPHTEVRCGSGGGNMCVCLCGPRWGSCFVGWRREILWRGEKNLSLFFGSERKEIDRVLPLQKPPQQME